MSRLVVLGTCVASLLPAQVVTVQLTAAPGTATIAPGVTANAWLYDGSLPGRTLAIVGDGNNIAASLAHGSAMLGVHFHIASPEGYELPPSIVQQATGLARHGARLRLFRDPTDAVDGADAVYTDTWTSMGQEAEAEVRRKKFAPYRVDRDLMAAAKPGALFMHCLPAHRDEEVTAEVFESAASVVFDQAENRLHGQKALLALLAAGA